MRYDDFAYLWPPRPDKAISKSLLPYYENLGWVAQVKLNGTANVMAVSPDRIIKAMTRHNDDHKMWAPSAKTAKIFQSLPGKGWYVFISELMHSKVPGIRDINYIHDVVVADGEQLVGSTFADRQKLLENLFKPNTARPISHYILDEHTWLAKNHTEDFDDLFEALDRPEYEGLVLKRPDAKLAPCTRQTANYSWQIKIRRPHKNFNF
jgi:hypothetical protein